MNNAKIPVTLNNANIPVTGKNKRNETNMKQGILNNSWLEVILYGKLKCNKLETRNTE